ncbi:hypothetical protein [Sciscionella marina]|uniref:hypothetical protein n=1 Tax=Sciscionella marina TaxID=508770 RepID=UPI0003706D47|nr:hypothetical protein [Sciscionella marina]
MNTGKPVSERATDTADHGVTTLAKLKAAGISEHAIATRCRTCGPWQRLFGKVVLLHSGPPNREQFLRAVFAHLGPGTVLTGADALRRHGARLEVPRGSVHVLVPANRRVGSPSGVIVERTTRTPRTIEADGVPLAAPARACIDAARKQPGGESVDQILLATLRDDLCSLFELETELEQGSQRGAATVRARLRDLSGKLASINEQRARRICAASRIPAPQWHAALTDAEDRPLTVVSAHWPDLDLSWDFTPSGHHAKLLNEQGRAAVHTPPRMLARDAARVRTLLETAYLMAGDRSASHTP